MDTSIDTGVECSSDWSAIATNLFGTTGRSVRCDDSVTRLPRSISTIHGSTEWLKGSGVIVYSLQKYSSKLSTLISDKEA